MQAFVGRMRNDSFVIVAVIAHPLMGRELVDMTCTDTREMQPAGTRVA